MSGFNQKLSVMLAMLMGLVAQDGVEAVDLQIGIVLPVTQEEVNYQFIAVLAAWHLDYSKNFNASLRARLGDPIVQVPNLNKSMQLHVGLLNNDGRPSLTISALLDFATGSNNRPKANGIVGPYWSSNSMPGSTLLGALNVPCISWGATNPRLSNKELYEYFSRTIPPDSIQASGVWKYHKHFEHAKMAVIYSAEPYGQGIFEKLINLAQSAGEPWAVDGCSLPYLLTWDNAVADASIKMMKNLGTKTSVIAVLTSDIVPRLDALTDNQYQFLFTEATVNPSNQRTGLVGTHGITPRSQGPLYDKWWDLFSQLNESDYAGNDFRRDFLLDTWAQEGGLFDKDEIFRSWFADPSSIDPYTYFFFDTMYVYVHVFSSLLNAGVPPSEIRGKKLLDAIRDVSFEGITGSVGFDVNGDRQADYNLCMMTNDNSKPWVNWGVYVAANDTLKLDPNVKLQWRIGEVSPKAPLSLGACPAGFAPDKKRQCRSCLPGTVARIAGSSECDMCLAGTYSDAWNINCGTCQAGEFALAQAANCTLCKTGTFQNLPGSSECNMCPRGKYATQEGQTSCEICGASAGQEGIWTTAYRGAMLASECRCPKDMYLSMRGRCEKCTEGVDCAIGSSEADLLKRCQEGSNGSGLVYPRPAKGFYTTCSDNPLQSFLCMKQARCQIQDVDSCAEGHVGIACGSCESGWRQGLLASCEKCDGFEKSSILFPLLPCIAGPLFVLVLYNFSRDKIENWTSPANQVTALAFVLLIYIQTVYSHNMLAVMWPSLAVDSLGWLGITWDTMSYMRPSCVLGVDFLRSTIISIMLPIWGALVFVGTYIMSCVIQRRMDQDVLQTCYFGVYNAFFIAVAQQTFTLFQCYQHPNGKLSLRVRPDILCHSTVWSGAAVIGAIGCLIFCVGVLAVFSYIIYRAPDQFDEGFRMRWKFLFLRFKPTSYGWQLCLLAKGMWVVLPTVISTDSTSQIAFLGVGTLLYLVGSAVFLPWRFVSVGIADIILNFALAMQTVFLPYMAILPHQLAIEQIAVKYVAFTYLAGAVVVVFILWYSYLRVSSRSGMTDTDPAPARRILDSFLTISKEDPKDLESVLKHLTSSDLVHMTSTVNILMKELLGVPPEPIPFTIGPFSFSLQSRRLVHRSVRQWF